MPSFAALWLPIVVSAVAIFVLSSVMHMVLPWHKSDYPRVANEDALMDALRPLAIPPGEYLVPRPQNMQDLKSPAFLEKMNAGPVFILRMLPNGLRPMSGPLFQWFIYLLVVDAFAAHIAQFVAPGAGMHRIFHVVALTSLLGYAAALWQMTIWYRRSAWITFKSTIDGLIYAIVTGLVFVWLWPK